VLCGGNDLCVWDMVNATTFDVRPDGIQQGPTHIRRRLRPTPWTAKQVGTEW